jgi:hypothetical protein
MRRAAKSPKAIAEVWIGYWRTHLPVYISTIVMDTAGTAATVASHSAVQSRLRGLPGAGSSARSNAWVQRAQPSPGPPRRLASSFVSSRLIFTPSSRAPPSRSLSMRAVVSCPVQYLTSYKGISFFTKSRRRLELSRSTAGVPDATGAEQDAAGGGRVDLESVIPGIRPEA